MKVRAEFCISHGDEMKMMGLNTVVPTVVFAHTLDHIWEFGMRCHYEMMSHHLVQAAEKEIKDGRMGENAHLVTHPEDRVKEEQ